MTEPWGLAGLINRAQASFVGLLRIWSIPIVVMLSIASGYTTYYGMSYFITWPTSSLTNSSNALCTLIKSDATCS